MRGHLSVVTQLISGRAHVGPERSESVGGQGEQGRGREGGTHIQSWGVAM